MCLFGMGVDMLRGQNDDWWDKLPPYLHLYNDMYFYDYDHNALRFHGWCVNLHLSSCNEAFKVF